MNIDSITNQAVEQFLKVINTGTEGSSALLDLRFLANLGFHSVTERKIRLFECLSQFVNEAYLNFRKTESLDASVPGSKIEAQHQLREDFGRGNSRLESLSALYFRYFSTLDFKIEELARNANVVPQQFRRRLNSGLTLLVNEVRRLEMAANSDAHRVDINIPLPDYSTLIGVDTLLPRLSEITSSLLPGQIVSVEGMGGIGKTALVHAFVGQDHIKQNYYQLLWVSARQSSSGVSHPDSKSDAANFTLEDVTTRLAQQLGLNHLVNKPLEERLKGIQAASSLHKYLLVIDNLETVDDYIQLVPALAKYASNCTIIITTRKSLREFPYVTVFPVPELPKLYVSQLLEAETNRRGRNFSIVEQDLEDIFETVGGLPLAVKLIATQIHLHPITEIIKEFKQAGKGVDSIYRFLYWKIWNSLSEPARKLLFTFLTLNPEGEDSEYTSLMSGLEPSIYESAFTELDNYSLIETNTLQSVPRFRIHRMTATFLQTDILKVWELEADAE